MFPNLLTPLKDSMCTLYRTELKYLGGLLQIFFVVYLPQLAQDFTKPNKTSFF